jgi:hypothetical protein
MEKKKKETCQEIEKVSQERGKTDHHKGSRGFTDMKAKGKGV